MGWDGPREDSQALFKFPQVGARLRKEETSVRRKHRGREAEKQQTEMGGWPLKAPHNKRPAFGSQYEALPLSAKRPTSWLTLYWYCFGV